MSGCYGGEEGERELGVPRVYHLCDDGVISTRRLVEVIAEGMGVKPRLLPLPRALAMMAAWPLGKAAARKKWPVYFFKSGASGAWLTPVQQILRSYDEPGDPGIGLREYLALVEATGRIMRGGKRGVIPADACSVLDRLGLDADAWLATVGRPRGLRGLRGSALGRVGALAVEAARRGLSWLQVRCAVFARESGVAFG